MDNLLHKVAEARRKNTHLAPSTRHTELIAQSVVVLCDALVIADDRITALEQQVAQLRDTLNL